MLSATGGMPESVAPGMHGAAPPALPGSRALPGTLTLKRKLTGTPEVSPGAIVATGDIQEELIKRHHRVAANMVAFAARVDKARDRVSVATDPVTEMAILRTAESVWAEKHEVDGFIRSVNSEKGVFAEVLNRRGPKALKIAQKSFCILGPDGTIRVAELLRDALKGVDEGWVALKAAHKEYGLPWCGQCEADVGEFASHRSPLTSWGAVCPGCICLDVDAWRAVCYPCGSPEPMPSLPTPRCAQCPTWSGWSPTSEIPNLPRGLASRLASRFLMCAHRVCSLSVSGLWALS